MTGLESNMGSSGRRVARHAGWMLSTQVLAAAMRVAQAVMVTRALGSDDFGVLVLAVTWTLTVGQLLDSRIWEPVIKFVPQFRAQRRFDQASGVVQFCCIIEIVSALAAVAVVLLTAPLVATILLKDAASGPGLVRLASVMVVLLIPVNPVTALLRLADRPAWIAGHQLIVGLVQTAATASVWLTAPSLVGFLAAQVLGLAIGGAFMLVAGAFACRRLGLDLLRLDRLATLRGHFREILRFCVMTNLTGCSRVLTSRADRLVLGLLATPAAVGVYDVARTIAAQLNDLVASLQMALFPEMSMLAAEGEHARLKRLQRQVSIVIAAIVVPGCVATMFAAPWVLPWIFGQEFAGSAGLLQILVWQLLWLPVVWIPGYLLVIGRAGTLTALTWFDAALFMAMLAVLVPALGATGAAWAMTARSIVWIGLMVLTLRRIGHVPVSSAKKVVNRPHRAADRRA